MNATIFLDKNGILIIDCESAINKHNEPHYYCDVNISFRGKEISIEAKRYKWKFIPFIEAPPLINLPWKTNPFSRKLIDKVNHIYVDYWSYIDKSGVSIQVERVRPGWVMLSDYPKNVGWVAEKYMIWPGKHKLQIPHA